jgi:hypothetical protein
MQPIVAATNTQSDRFQIGDRVFDACKQYWKDTPATNKDLACSQLRKSIRLSAAGITGKRAGLICSLMGECDGATVGSNCSINATSAVGSLDLCTVEGVVNASMVPGILTTAGVRK